jgi:hypothetical protein
MAPLPLSYVLPLRSSDDAAWPELSRYLDLTAGIVDEVIVADGSPPAHFERHRRDLAPAVRHIAPHPDLGFAMGKVNGVVSGIREARNEAVVVADDDVRWTSDGLVEAKRLLDRADLVRPQNYFEPLVWHARLDTGRILLNRALPAGPGEPAADFPGTLVLRRSTFMATNGYDGDALFENLELIRTVRAGGGRVEDPVGLYVARRPPSARHYLSQRVRQAYDDFALPARMAAWLCLLPAVAVLARRQRRVLPAAWVAIAAAAELGRRRAGGVRVFPVSSSLLAPLWVIERAICSWLALRDRLLRGGVRYGEGRLRHAATSQRELDERYGRYRVTRTVAGAGEDPGALSASKPISL